MLQICNFSGEQFDLLLLFPAVDLSPDGETDAGNCQHHRPSVDLCQFLGWLYGHEDVVGYCVHWCVPPSGSGISGENLLQITGHLIPDLDRPHVLSAKIDGKKTALSVPCVVPFQKPRENIIYAIPVKTGIIHGTKSQTGNHSPKPLSGSVADVGVIHDMLFASDREGNHHFKHAAWPVVQEGCNHAVIIVLLAAESISKVDAVLGPVAVHRNRICEFRIVQPDKQLTIGLRISVVDYELVHPIEISIEQLIPGQRLVLLSVDAEACPPKHP
nr:MAG TPA: hypothetical protein [Caudoviricetes sp.]